MDQDQSLTPVEEKTVIFYDDELTAVRLDDGDIFVPVRRLCDNLGLAWGSQRNRIYRDDVLADAVKSVFIMNTDPESKYAPGRSEMLCLPLDMVPGWLFGIQTSRVREEIRDKLVRYRRECFRVLWDAFKGDILPAVDPALVVPSESAAVSSAERALVQAEVLYNLARQQVALERWMANHDGRIELLEDDVRLAQERLDRAAGVVGRALERVNALELRVFGPYQVISEAQAAELADLVKTIAHTLTRRNPEGGNYYQQVWTTLHRRYGVTSYRRVAADKFHDVVIWLESWLENLRSVGFEEPDPDLPGMPAGSGVDDQQD